MPTPIEDAELKRTLSLHRAGAEQDDVEHQYMLVLFSCARREHNNKIHDYKWFRIWVSNPSFDNAKDKECKSLEDILAKDMSEKDMTRAQELADDWIKRNRKTT